MDRETATVPVHGFVAPGFDAVQSAFAENFARESDYREVGASFAAFHAGRCVAELWGGFRDRDRKTPWTRDTLVNVWSSTKGVVATAMAILVDRGLVSYDAPVARYWPQFAANGKEGMTVAQLLSHQAGLCGFVEPTTIEDMYDWSGCAAKLSRQAPAWEPGTATSYHAMTYGWLAGEIIRIVSGKSAGAFVADEIALPLGADLFIGLPRSQESRVAELIGPKRAAAIPPLPPVAMMALVNPQQNPEAPNSRAWREAEIPAANGHATAMGLARLYAMLAARGEFEGRRLLRAETVARLASPATSDGRRDMFLGFSDSWGMGVAINTPGIYGPNPRAFGHSGWGGSFGCADPDAGVAIGYVCNQMGPELVGDPRTTALCRAVLDCAGKAPA